MAMSTFVRRVAVLALAAGGLFALGADKPAQDPPSKPAPAYQLSGPYTHGNLTVFLIHGADQIKGKDFLTLDEALEQKKVVVHETQNVNQLTIENLSPTDQVFVQAGDIVKGGQQDRLITFDLILPPKSGKMPIAVFCVEAGRWSGRGAESAAMFSSSKDQAATKGVKLAARAAASQPEVWAGVRKAQSRLQMTLGKPVQAAQSRSSLQLTLENKDLGKAVDSYVKELASCAGGQDDVIGCAFAINGTVSSADVYASHNLFRKLWPKLLKASAVEAVAELHKDKKFEAVNADRVRTFLADAERGKKTAKEVTQRIRQVQHETDKNILFETHDRDEKGAPVRRSYISK
jgi:hypothetical protein